MRIGVTKKGTCAETPRVELLVWDGERVTIESATAGGELIAIDTKLVKQDLYTHRYVWSDRNLSLAREPISNTSWSLTFFSGATTKRGHVQRRRRRRGHLQGRPE